ncbi:MAG: DUF305 domain-containing protein [Microbacterium sp.]|uniref:DUF305 domain-containing protein n=1 Tax=Microbacterium sp. TaxID=51671 RepID=UPI0039E49EAA
MAGAPADPPRWLLVAVAVLAAAALAFGIGRFTAFDTGGSTAPAEAANAADAGFARDMQTHHAQAVEMAMTAYRSTADDELRALAYDIATGQAAQSGQMYEWLVGWGLPQAGDPPMLWMSEHAGHGEAMTDAELREAMGMATDAELSALRAAPAGSAEGDCLFLRLMVRHHEGAISMVAAVLERGSQPRVLEVAGAMKATQSAEIDAMRGMQRSLGCAG